MLRLVSFCISAFAAGAFVPSSNRVGTRFLATKASDSTTVVSHPSIFASTSLFAPAISTTELCAGLAATELPEKLYLPKEKETPKVLGGLKIGLRKLVVITGASSGLGLNCAETLAKTGRYFVVMACRDVEKGKQGTCECVADNIIGLLSFPSAIF